MARMMPAAIAPPSPKFCEPSHFAALIFLGCERTVHRVFTVNSGRSAVTMPSDLTCEIVYSASGQTSTASIEGVLPRCGA